MSTRGHVVFRIDGTDKVMYNHSDSYPSWLGERVTAFIRKNRRDGKLFKSTAEKIRKLRVVSNEIARPTPAEQKKYMRFFQHVSEGVPSDWYALLRELQGELQATLNEGIMLDGSDIPWEDYTYIIDADANVLRIVGYEPDDKETVIEFADVPQAGRLTKYLATATGVDEEGNRILNNIIPDSTI
jgi:hypothetical protein